jgi:hypothetical protein
VDSAERVISYADVEQADLAGLRKYFKNRANAAQVARDALVALEFVRILEAAVRRAIEENRHQRSYGLPNSVPTRIGKILEDAIR